MAFVIFLCSTSQADYLTDFEGWVTADLDVAPWSTVGSPNVVITTGLGSNASDVAQVGGNGFAWLEPAVADQFALGTLAFDLLMSGVSPGWPALTLILSEDPAGGGGGVQAVYLRIASEPGAGGDDLDLFIFDPGLQTGSVVLQDFLARDVWAHLRIDFDAVADTYDLYVDGALEINNREFWGNVTKVNRISWNNPVGYYAQIDNVDLADVPAPSATFTDRTASLFPTSGVLVPGYWVCWADYTGDGLVDFSDFGRVYKNNGGAGFTWQGYFGDIWGDYDNDGKLDGYRWWSNVPQLYRNQSTPAVTSFDNPITMPDLPAGGATSSGTSLAGCWADFNSDGYLDVFVGGADPTGPGGTDQYHDVLLINNNATSFSSSTVGGPAKYTKGVTACDWDEDGDMDIYVSIYDLNTPNRLLRNNGSAVFTDVAATTHLNARNTSPGFVGSWAGGGAWGDIDNDGDFDLFAGNFSHAGQPQSRFLENRGPDFDYRFTDKGQSGVAWVESYISPTLGDYDNDGDLDLFFTAVYAGDLCRLYRNDSSGGTWTFTHVSAAEGLGGIGPTAQGAWADIDNDGDLDLVAQQRIFVNSSSENGNHWLRVHLIGNGTTVNRAAIGSKVRIVVPGLGTLSRHVEAGTGQGNQNEPTLHFGLGSHAGPVTLEVRWTDGTTQIVPNVGVDQLVDIELVTDFSLTSVLTEAGANVVIRWESAAGAAYTVGRGTDPVGGVFAPLASGLPATPPINVYTDTVSGADNATYRIEKE